MSWKALRRHCAARCKASLAAVRTYLPQAHIRQGSDFPYLASARTIAGLRLTEMSARSIARNSHDNARALFAQLKV